MLDPLGQSQVIPYLKELSLLGVRFWLLSFERAHAFEQSGIEKSRALREELAGYGIEWHALRYHQKPSVPATAYDVAAGIRFASRLVRKHKIELIHARAHIPAVIALALKRRYGAKIIFDVRGLMTEEYLDANHWKAGSIAARLSKSMETRVLRSTDGLVTLTEALWKEMRRWEPLKRRSVVHQTIPCCVDFDKYRFDSQERNSRRAELNLNDRFVLVYSGSVGGWYMTDEMASFFLALKRRMANAFFLWLINGSPEIVHHAMQQNGIASEDYSVKRVSSAEVPAFLSSADAGIAFYRPGISRLGTSPVKVSEYLACGLPVVINAGIGDSDQIIAENNLGALVHDFTEAEYARAADLVAHLGDDRTARKRTREAARTLFDLIDPGVRRYARLYEDVLA